MYIIYIYIYIIYMYVCIYIGVRGMVYIHHFSHKPTGSVTRKREHVGPARIHWSPKLGRFDLDSDDSS